MNFNEKEKVAALMKEIIDSGRNKENKVIEDLTEQQAKQLLTQYSGYSRILSAFPQTLLSNPKFLLSIKKEFNIFVCDYAHPSVLSNINFIDEIMKTEECASLGVALKKNYNSLSKQPSFLLSIIVKMFKSSEIQGYTNYNSIQFIEEVLKNNDLALYKKDLSLLLKKLGKADALKKNSLLQKMNQSSARKLIALLDDCAEAEKEVEAIHNQQEIDEDPIENT